ncbi:SDR family oxidoreductase [Aestuariibacter sp. AA17]|uniref:SDR family oxidoreductase n=1 Tax=Fluctibacter corallii TaxID=2984329 RepID=A0ABT3A566_9ALTE|nr:SDR family oxidoreductase [Aestuariibacter sp. AA17]MCV2883789.1 SDR family oxidoreductase [Aestuariibacter sp. AA17]
MDTLLDFSGKCALITGAGSGFGERLATALAERRCNLVLGDINESTLTETVKSLEQFDVQVKALVGDVSNEGYCSSLAHLAEASFKRLDFAVNNAGVAHKMSPIHTLTEDTINQQMQVNVNSVLFGMKSQIPIMLKQQRGHVLNISSMAGIGGAPKGGAYSAAKHAVVGLTRTAAIEYARYGIQVNALCPFFSPTNIMNVEGLASTEEREKLASGCPMKRLAEPQEIVNTMVLLLSPGNSFMTGQAIAVDGGVSAW